ncbi:glutathione S-transferase family protein [Sphingomonas donggukensis]|uniref:Glutathione S-transferase family protein n=1 Tax=Sphingomonas donggukensis TaxID=2949093 RepID=A0ABY4TUJ1_9SPHN|nr:glutathione S-transferase family protein [Sphingomonas donggukensis]URW76073.1 glutathione S-transferase family protein [Sphingomonas donggukensis]
MPDLTLYTNPMSRGRIARWMLEEVGQPYETVIVQFGDETIRGVNPMAKVPTVVHGERTITECAAICAYLADAFPAAGLAPATDDRADYYRWLFFAAGPVEQALTSNSLGWTPTAEQQGMVGFGSYDRVVDTLEQAVADLGDGWLTGDRFTAADLYVGAHLSWGTGFGTLPKRPAFMAFVERVNARPAARRAAEIDDALIAEMKRGA